MSSADLTARPVVEQELGATVVSEGVLFTVWAPRQRSVRVRIHGGRDVPMEAAPDGYHRALVTGLRAGARYSYVLAEGARADPASRFQPDGVFGPSMVVDPSTFTWTDTHWFGAVAPHRQVVYELHIGTFTIEGTWAGAQRRLTELAALGVTTLEVMPVAEFGGRFGWGYDGVLFFAPFHEYGTPDDLRRFVDAAHAAGLAVILDVVYNHTGPVGSYFPDFSDTYMSSEDGEWGRAFNLDGPGSGPVRDYIRANVRLWLEEYHFDGLRFDAVQAILDRSPEYLVDELTRYGRELCQGRRLYFVAEHERQDVSILGNPWKAPRGVDSIWNEDWHHAAFVAMTGRREAYFTDYTGEATEFASMARWNTLYQGQWYSWQTNPRGSDARHLTGASFVWFIENHDQVANTGLGLRLHQTVDPALWRAMIGLQLLGPGVPMLFMGQELAVPEPFCYFADHDAELAAQVRAGREKFLAQFPRLRDTDAIRQLPLPSDETRFLACRMQWQDTPVSTRARQLHSDLLTLRRTDPVIGRAGTGDIVVASSAPTPQILLIRYQSEDGERLVIVNLGRTTTMRMNDPLLAPPAGHSWQMAWCSEQVEYGGSGVAPSFGEGQWRLQPRCTWLLLAASVGGFSRPAA